MKTFLGKEQPQLVPQAQEGQDLMDVPVGETLGSFLGYLRRAKSSKHGLTAQVFGENGQDADFITTLHLTRFLDATVKVTIWIIKDKNGKLLYRDGENNTPITSFIGRILRPTSSNSGQTAQFFGENGANADAVNRLNESKYLDALVLVELQKAEPGMIASEISTDTPLSELKEGQQRLTAEEQQKLKKQQKKAESALQVLRQNRFFSQDAVLRLLGSEQIYKDWLQTQPCCHPGSVPCDKGPIQVFAVAGPKRMYAYVPLCQHHAEEWTAGLFPESTLGSPAEFLKSRQIFYAQYWGQEKLRQELKVPPGYDPTPANIYSWAVSKNLATLLPHSFMSYLHD